MLRLLVTPRWVGWTLLAVLAVVLCAAMAYWQLGRAESPTGSLLNAGYALQWPIFGVFFAVLWWRMLRQEGRALAEIETGGTPDAPAPLDPTAGPTAGPTALDAALAEPAGGSPFTARPRGVDAGDGQGEPVRGSARAEYNAALAALADDAAVSPDRRAFVPYTGPYRPGAPAESRTGPTGDPDTPRSARP